MLQGERVTIIWCLITTLASLINLSFTPFICRQKRLIRLLVQICLRELFRDSSMAFESVVVLITFSWIILRPIVESLRHTFGESLR